MCSWASIRLLGTGLLSSLEEGQERLLLTQGLEASDVRARGPLAPACLVDGGNRQQCVAHPRPTERGRKAGTADTRSAAWVPLGRAGPVPGCALLFCPALRGSAVNLVRSGSHTRPLRGDVVKGSETPQTAAPSTYVSTYLKRYWAQGREAVPHSLWVWVVTRPAAGLSCGQRDVSQPGLTGPTPRCQ